MGLMMMIEDARIELGCNRCMGCCIWVPRRRQTTTTSLEANTNATRNNRQHRTLFLTQTHACRRLGWRKQEEGFLLGKKGGRSTYGTNISGSGGTMGRERERLMMMEQDGGEMSVCERVPRCNHCCWQCKQAAGGRVECPQQQQAAKAANRNECIGKKSRRAIMEEGRGVCLFCFRARFFL